MSHKTLRYTLLLLIVPFALAYGQISKIPFEVTVHGSYNSYGMKELNNLTIAKWKSLGYKKFPGIETGLGFGAGARAIVTENWSVGFNYTRLTGSTEFTGSKEETTVLAIHKQTGDFSYDVSANVFEFVPMYNLSPSTVVDVYLGVGLGYYLSAGEGMEVATDSIRNLSPILEVDFKNSPGYPINRKGPIEGGGMGMRVFMEFDFPINDNIFAFGDLGWRFASTEEVAFASAMEYSGYYVTIGAGYHFKFGKQPQRRAD